MTRIREEDDSLAKAAILIKLAILPRDAMHISGCAVAARRLSVRLSIARRYFVETAKNQTSGRRIATPFYCFNTKRYGNIPTGPL